MVEIGILTEMGTGFISTITTGKYGLFYFCKNKIVISAGTLLMGVFLANKYLSRRKKLSIEDAIVITGCDSGLGYSLARHCHELGAIVVAGVLSPDSEGAATLKFLGIRIIPLNVNDPKSIDHFVAELQRFLKSNSQNLNAFVNNAGVMVFGEFEWQLPDHARRQIDTNILGTMMVTQKLLPLIRNYNSRIINVTSHCALMPLPGLSIYGATKAALKAWSDALRIEMAKYGVKVISFIPGSFITGSNLMSRQLGDFQEMRSGMSAEATSFYGEYFERYAKYLEPLSVKRKAQVLSDPQVYKVFDGALLDRYPASFYKCEPWRYTIYYTLFRLTPTPVGDYLIEKFVSMPPYRRSRNNAKN